ncbi:hypothetical protein F4823DRAFT_638723 [Ustulina deusta]|nr:hypothetical protein F4823DRAFT_638723 [Ustulina deusta]
MPRVRVLRFKLCYCQKFVEAITNGEDGNTRNEDGSPRDEYKLIDHGKEHLEVERAYLDIAKTSNEEDGKLPKQQNFAKESEERPKIEDVPKIVDHDKVKVISYTWGHWGWRKEEVYDNQSGETKTETNIPKRVIGHEKMPADRKINADDFMKIRLGDEWAESDHNASFVKTLDRICNGTNDQDGPYYCWIDQLSGEQGEDEKVRKTLNMVPVIYRTLPVVAILPGAKCRCMVDYSEITNQHSPNQDYLTGLNMEFRDDSLNRHRSCFNTLGCAQYFRRLWPRQELYYAHEIRAEWTSEDILPCPAITVGFLGFRSLFEYRFSALKAGFRAAIKHRSWDHFEIGEHLHSTLDLSSFRHLNVCVRLDWERQEDDLLPIRKKLGNGLGRGVCSRWNKEAQTLADPPSLFRDQVDEGNVCIICRDTQRIIFNQQMLSKAMSTRIIAERAMSDWFMLSGHDTGAAAGSRQTLDKFLAGRVIKKAREPHMTNRQKLSQFLTMLGTLSSSFRDLTKPRDLVLAVWVDCPLYKIPEDSKNMSLERLLDDALSQLRENWGVSPLTSLPSGLLPSNSPESMSPLAWSPSRYLSSTTRYTSTSVYAPVTEWARYDKHIVVTSENPTKFVMEYPIPGQSRIMDFQDGEYTKEAHDFIVAAMSAWPHPALVRLTEYAHPSFMAFLEEKFSWPTNHGGLGLRRSNLTFLLQLVTPAIRHASMNYLDLGRGLNKLLLSIMTDVSAFDTVAEGEDWELALNTVFDVVCYIIGIDSDDAVSAELHLVLDTGGNKQPPRLGLSRERIAGTRLQNFYLVPPNKNSWLRCRKVMIEVSTPDDASTEPNPHSNSTITGIWIQPKDMNAERCGSSEEEQMGLVPLEKHKLNGGLLDKPFEWMEIGAR